MNRRVFLSAVTGGLLAAPLAAEAQRAGKGARIGYLGTASASSSANAVEAFRAGLRDLGHVEGQTAVIEYRWADGQYERLPALAAELIDLRMDVIFAATQQAALATRNATTTIPIVIAVATDPVELGLIGSLARPRWNVTGLTSLPGPEFVGKQLELFKEAIPRLARVAVLGNLANPAHTQRLKGTDGAARSMQLQLQILWARGPNEFESAFRAMVSAGAHGLLVLHDAMFWSHRRQLADLAATHHMPTMFQWREHVDAGGLMAYGANIPDLARRAATFVDKILRGAKPADLPAEQPTKFELVINLKTAKALGLTIPQSLLLRADQVIE